MLPLSAFNYYKKVILFTSSINLFPYSWKWDKKQEKFIARKTTWSQIKYWTQMVIMILYQLILVGRAWNLGFDKSIPLAKKFGVQNLIFTYIGMDYGLLSTFFNSDKFPLLVNNFVNITKKFDRDSSKGTTKCEKGQEKSVNRSISFVVVPGILFGVANVMAVMKRPNSPLLLTSLASEPLKLPLALRICYLFFHSYLQCLQYTMAVFHLVTVICYVEAMLPMIEGLSLSKGKVQASDEDGNNILSSERLYHYYHELRILQCIFNSSYSYWALGAQTFLTIFCIGNIFQAGALQNTRGLFNAMFQMFLIKLIFKHLAQVFEASVPTLQSWREFGRDARNLWFQKFIKSCQPFRVVVGSFYFADNTLILTMIAVISTNAASMIVAYKGA